MFELSDKNPKLLVRNIGYMYASGVSQSLGMLLSSGISSTCNTRSNTKILQGSRVGHEVNPVTGQWRDAESVDGVPEMTDEEKEREAERLFVLFER